MQKVYKLRIGIQTEQNTHTHYNQPNARNEQVNWNEMQCEATRRDNKKKKTSNSEQRR